MYPMQNPVPNAYTLAIGGRKPFIVVHTALLELLEPLEVQVGHSCYLNKPCNTTGRLLLQGWHPVCFHEGPRG